MDSGILIFLCVEKRAFAACISLCVLTGGYIPVYSLQGYCLLGGRKHLSDVRSVCYTTCPHRASFFSSERKTVRNEKKALLRGIQ